MIDRIITDCCIGTPYPDAIVCTGARNETLRLNIYDAFGAVNASTRSSDNKQKLCGSFGHAKHGWSVRRKCFLP